MKPIRYAPWSFGIVSVVGLALAHGAWGITASDMIELTGVTNGDRLGNSIAKGDFNGDGFEDIVVGSYYGYNAATQTGLVHLFYGGADTVVAGSAGTTADATFYGEAQYDWAGISVGAGDFNADGYDDILIGSLFFGPDDSDTGAVHLIYGQADALTGGSLSSAIQFTGVADLDYFGYAVAGIGDVDNDGYDDMALSAPNNSGGIVYIVYGRSASYSSAVINTIGTRIVGDAAADNLGYVVAAAGDLNEDGFDDFLMGGDGIDSPGNNAGAVYVVYGQAADYQSPSSANDFIRLTGTAASESLGYYGTTADLDGDGHLDLVIGSPFYDSGGNTSIGALYIVYGSGNALSDGTIMDQGVRITGVAAEDDFGYYASNGGNVDQTDGDELYVGSPYFDGAGTAAGAIYLLSGGERLSSGVITSIDHTRIDGEAQLNAFGSASAAVDLNGDGFGELIAAAPLNGDAANNAGALFVGYVAMDLDGDNELSPDGLITQGIDCDDSDAGVTEDQTFYLDEDGDGLGVGGSNITECLSEAPDGYADNDDDTNDHIRNNGVEIGNDSIDNDGDGDVDEVNTVAENGAHPEYGNNNPSNGTMVDRVIRSVRAVRHGKVRVKFKDYSVYVYTAFSGVNGKPKIKQVPDTGFYAVLDSRGQKVALLNILNGRVRDRARFDQAGYRQHFLQFDDLRNDGKDDLVVASSQGDTVRVATAQVNTRTAKWKHAQTIEVLAPDAQLNRTTVVGNTIDVRNALTAIVSVLIQANHHLIQL